MMYLLPLTPTDFPFAATCYRAGLASMLTSHPYASDEYIAAVMSAPDSLWHTVVVDSSPPVGLLSLEHISWIDGTAEPGVCIIEGERRKGYGLSAMRMHVALAFGDLRLRRLTIPMLADSPSRALVEAAGGVHEGTMRAVRRRGTTYVDGVMYAIIKEPVGLAGAMEV